MEVLAILISVTFIFLAGLHFYWSAFGIKDPSKILPTRANEKRAMAPGKYGAIAVGLILLFFAFIFINKIVVYVDSDWTGYLAKGIAVIFILRAFGDFKYVGFFKSSKNGKFSMLDTRYYSPLCLLLGVLILILELWQ